MTKKLFGYYSGHSNVFVDWDRLSERSEQYSLSSGERKGKSPNQKFSQEFFGVVRQIRYFVNRPGPISFGTERFAKKGKVTNFLASRICWKTEPKQVIVP